jgi:hypothetical protein
MVTITGGGVFTRQNISDINTNFQSAMSGNPTGQVLWVRPQNGGVDTNPGTYAQPLATMAGCAKYLKSGLVIYVEGVLREQTTLPIVSNVKVVGLQTVPCQATTSGAPNGGSATWLSPLSGISNTTALATVQGQGWTFENIYFNNAATAAGCVKLLRSGAGDPPTDPDASHAAFINCRFTGANLGIEDSGGCGFVHISGCEFFNFSGSGDTAIKNTSTSVAAPLRWVIERSAFWGNVNHIVAAANQWTVTNNTFAAATTTNINFTGGTAPNFVQQNTFAIAAADFDPAGGVTGVTGDAWSNYLTDAVETGLPAN